jgi:hypothetical protein
MGQIEETEEQGQKKKEIDLREAALESVRMGATTASSYALIRIGDLIERQNERLEILIERS